MIARLLMIAGFAGLCALTLPDMTGRYLAWRDRPAAAVNTVAVAARPASGGREVVIAAGPGGHFQATLEMNGRAVPGLIDTGATMVAISETTARRIGLSPATLDYAVPVSTANGTTRAARATLSRVRIGGITIEDVDAMVLPDTALSGTLIGMSFLGRLSSYGVEDGALKLRR